MPMPRTAKRRPISEGWRPSADDAAFAEALGLDVEVEAAMFLDYHLANGTLMLDWHAGWRTWCRRAVEFGRATSQRALPLLSVVPKADPADPFGARDWARNAADTGVDRFDGELRPAIGGFDIAGVAVDICRAAGLDPSWRGDLSLVAEWLRTRIAPDAICQAIITSRKPERLTSLRFFDTRVRDAAQRKAG